VFRIGATEKVRRAFRNGDRAATRYDPANVEVGGWNRRGVRRMRNSERDECQSVKSNLQMEAASRLVRSSEQGHMKDVSALRGDERRGNLR
jgi:hypothetical protein